MLRVFSLCVAIILLAYGGYAQSLPSGVSNFFRELGGLNPQGSKVEIFQRLAGRRIDKVEGGGDAADWTELEGRVYVRAAWMTEIGEMTADYTSYELEQALAADMQKKLASEGFRITPSKFNLSYVRYQKGSTIGMVEVRSFFLNGGNLPLRYEFIFNESYRPRRKARRK